MIKVEKSVTINKPIDEVFNFLAGAGNYTKWQSGVNEVIDHGPRNTVGSQYTESANSWARKCAPRSS